MSPCDCCSTVVLGITANPPHKDQAWGVDAITETQPQQAVKCNCCAYFCFMCVFVLYGIVFTFWSWPADFRYERADADVLPRLFKRSKTLCATELNTTQCYIFFTKYTCTNKSVPLLCCVCATARQINMLICMCCLMGVGMKIYIIITMLGIIDNNVFPVCIQSAVLTVLGQWLEKQRRVDITLMTEKAFTVYPGR